MKKKSKILVSLLCLAVFVISAFCLYSLSGASSSALNVFKKKYPNISESEIAERLSKDSFSEVCDEINTLSAEGVRLSSLVVHSSVIAEKAKDISSDEIMSIIESKKNSDQLRILCVQILGANGRQLSSENTEKLKKLILDRKTDSELRQNILWVLPNGAETDAALEELVFGSDDRLAFQALKRLSFSNPRQAQTLSEKLLDSGEMNERSRMAINVMSAYYAKGSAQEREKWIQFVSKIFQKALEKNDTLLMDTVVFALSDMYCTQALSYILGNDYVDEAVKSYCVQQNFNVLINALSADPSDANIELAVAAMRICPVDKTVAALKAAVEKSGKSYDISEILSAKAEPANEHWISVEKNVKAGGK